MDKGKIKHFDFSKKPISPCFLMSVTKGIISFPDLRKRKFNYEMIEHSIEAKN